MSWNLYTKFYSKLFIYRYDLIPTFHEDNLSKQLCIAKAMA
jgi:hypothetical protein